MSLHESNSDNENDANNNSSVSNILKASRWPRLQNSDEEISHIPKFVFDPDSSLVFYWSATVAFMTLYNAWSIALRIAFPEVGQEGGLFYLYYIDMMSDFIYLMDIFIQLRTAYLQDGIPVFEPSKIRQQYMSQTYFVQDVISVLPSHTILSFLPDAVGCKYFLCTAGGARLTKLLKFHILYRFYDLAESFTSNPHLIRVLRLFLSLAIIIHWIACSYYLLSEYEGLGSNEWVYTSEKKQQRFSRKYIICLYWSTMTLTTIGNTNSPETDVEYIFTGLIFLTGVFVFATVMGNVGDVISSMNANRQEFQARMDHIQMYLTHKKVPASLQLKIKKWAEYTWSRTKATDESRLLNMLPERLRAEVAVHVHLDSLKKIKIFEQCETGFLCELVLKLRSQVYSPGDYVCRAGETGREMFIINHGKVEVLVPSPVTNKDMVVAVLSEGNYFGEISLLRLDGVQNRRTADVRSIGYSELLCLSRKDLMTALIEYPEAKSILEGQAKKRMKTNLQAQRAFSVDTLLRNSQDLSSDGSIAPRDETGHDVSEIKAMIQELKNANKVPGRTVWQLITRCEVLQAKLSEKEKEIEDSKQRVKDLEELLFSRYRSDHNPEMNSEQIDTSTNAQKLRQNGKVIKQYSQDEGRSEIKQSYIPSLSKLSGRNVPHLKVTRASESDDETESDITLTYKDDNCIKTSKITSISHVKPKRSQSSPHVSEDRTDDIEIRSHNNQNGIPKRQQTTTNELPKNSQIQNGADSYKIFTQNIQSSHSSEDGTFLSETSVNHEFIFDDYDHLSLKTSFSDEMFLNDSYTLDVHTIPEENEDEVEDSFHFAPVAKLYSSRRPLASEVDAQVEEPSPNSIYRDLDASDQEVKYCRRASVKPSATAERLHTISRASDPRRRFLNLKKRSISLDSIKLDHFEFGSDENFMRFGSLNSCDSDEGNSRRNSWNWDSENEEDSEDDGNSSENPDNFE